MLLMVAPSARFPSLANYRYIGIAAPVRTL